MPELPEVETVCRELRRSLPQPAVVEQVDVHCRALRAPIPVNFPQQLEGEKILGVRRRAKFLLLDTTHYTVLNHLGMTGNWRREGPEQVHDHCVVHFRDGGCLVFNDPRRFGVLDIVMRGREETTPWLGHLGFEPWDVSFTGAYLKKAARSRRLAIKNWLMDQRLVVGVGNIYASEALFWAGIRPGIGARRLSQPRLERLIEALRNVLGRAIERGGTTIRDYRPEKGGSYRQELAVYNRAEKPCCICGTPIRFRFLNGRSTYWCPQCQR